ncbi:MAG: hypothetical protein ACOVN5_13145 [Aquidulcibacter sp.]|jgi:hypothetical protein
MSQQHALPTAVTPTFVRRVNRARHLLNEAELYLKPFGTKAPQTAGARQSLRLAIRELEAAL